MHFDDLFGNREAKPSAALGFGVGVIDLVELLENACSLLFRYARTGIRHADGELAVDGFGRDPHLTCVRELDGVSHKIEQHLGEALLITKTNGERLGTSVLSSSFLFWARDPVAERTVSTTLSMAYSAMFRVN